MPSYTATIISMLEESVERLKADLAMLQDDMKRNKEGMYITHDNDEMLVVYTTIRYKAYVPKTYDDWPVKFIEWNGEEIPIDIDMEIDT